MRPLFFVLFTFLSVVVAQGAPKNLSLVKQVLRRYQKSEAVEIKISKKVHLSLLDETKESSGKLVLSKGRLRMEIEPPDESLLVMNKNIIWLATPTPEELGGKTQVLKIPSSKLSQQSRAPIAFLLGKESVWDQFVVQGEERKNSVTELKLKQKSSKEKADIKSVNLWIDHKNQRIEKLAYKDELDNETSYRFLETDFKAKPEDKKFEYVPPKDSEVTEY